MSRETNDDVKSSFEGARAQAYIGRTNATKYPPQFLEEIVRQTPQNAKFLDAGCGTGNFLEQLIAKAQEMDRSDIAFFAFDYSETMVAETKKRNLQASIFQDDLKNLTSEVARQKFDFVLSRDVMFFFKPGDERKEAFDSLAALCANSGFLRVDIRKISPEEKAKEGAGSFKHDLTQEELEQELSTRGFRGEISFGKMVSYGGAGGAQAQRMTFVGSRSKELSTPAADTRQATAAQAAAAAHAR